MFLGEPTRFQSPLLPCSTCWRPNTVTMFSSITTHGREIVCSFLHEASTEQDSATCSFVSAYAWWRPSKRWQVHLIHTNSLSVMFACVCPSVFRSWIPTKVVPMPGLLLATVNVSEVLQPFYVSWKVVVVPGQCLRWRLFSRVQVWIPTEVAASL